MPKQFNPYIFGEPIRDHRAFYGRTKLVAIVYETLSVATENLLVFYGQRRIGKTSLAHNLKYWQELSRFIFVHNDANEIASKNAVEVLYRLGYKIAEVFDLPPLDKSALQKDIELFQKDFLPQVNKKLDGKRLVIILDEFDAFDSQETTVEDESASRSNSALSVIEDLMQNAPPELAFIVFLARGEKRLGSELRQILRTSRWAKVSLLEAEETRKLIIEPARGVLDYLPEVTDEVMSLTSGHPYYIQLVCHEIFNELQMTGGKKEVRVSDVRNAAQRALDSGQGGFGWLWQGISSAERLVLSLLADTAEPHPDRAVTEGQLSQAFETQHIYRAGVELTSAIEQLIELDLIERTGPRSYRFLVELIRQWIYKNHPLAQERDEQLAHLSQRAAAEFAQGQAASTLAEGIRHYRAAVAANPNHIEARLTLGEALLKAKQFEEAVEVYRAASWLDQSRAKPRLEKAEEMWDKIERRKRTVSLIWLVASLAVLAVVVLWGFSFFKPYGGQLIPPPPIPTETIRNPEVTSTPVGVSEAPTPTLTPTIPPEPTMTEATPTSTNASVPSPMPPSPTSSNIPTPTENIAPLPTATPSPTKEPSPTLSPAPTATPSLTSTTLPPQDTPIPIISPTTQPTAMIDTYETPVLLNPGPETRFSGGQELVLEWRSVGTLGKNERYAVRIIFNVGDKVIYKGDQLKETTWIVSREFQQQVNGPERKFTWYVYVERDTGGESAVQISPDSERRVFYWGPD